MSGTAHPDCFPDPRHDYLHGSRSTSEADLDPDVEAEREQNQRFLRAIAATNDGHRGTVAAALAPADEPTKPEPFVKSSADRVRELARQGRIAPESARYLVGELENDSPDARAAAAAAMARLRASGASDAPLQAGDFIKAGFTGNLRDPGNERAAAAVARDAAIVATDMAEEPTNRVVMDALARGD